MASLLSRIRKYLRFAAWEQRAHRQLLADRESFRLQQLAREKHPKSLIPFGAKVYSQNDEDGIIQEIFRRIGTTNTLFVEFGVQDGLECNTAKLLLEGWRGLWIEADSTHTRRIRQGLPGILASGRLLLEEAFITRDNINELISTHISEAEIDLLSVDIDGNDFHVLQAITCIKPRVMVVEYNEKFPPPMNYCMAYDPEFQWTGGDCFGVSLNYLTEHLEGYCLVGCNLSGSNAFFVRKDLTANHFQEPFTAEEHFQPGRSYLYLYRNFHSARYQTFERAMKLTEKP